MLERACLCAIGGLRKARPGGGGGLFADEGLCR